jgi:hypothetical protein
MRGKIAQSNQTRAETTDEKPHWELRRPTVLAGSAGILALLINYEIDSYGQAEQQLFYARLLNTSIRSASLVVLNIPRLTLITPT